MAFSDVQNSNAAADTTAMHLLLQRDILYQQTRATSEYCGLLH